MRDIATCVTAHFNARKTKKALKLRESQGLAVVLVVVQQLTALPNSREAFVKNQYQNGKLLALDTNPKRERGDAPRLRFGLVLIFAQPVFIQ